MIRNKDAIIKLVPTMNSHKSLDGLSSIQNSCSLISGLVSFGVMNRVIPNRMQYPDPNDPAAKQPKSVEVLPMEHMRIEETGFYVLQVQEENARSSKKLWLILFIILIFCPWSFRAWL